MWWYSTMWTFSDSAKHRWLLLTVTCSLLVRLIWLGLLLLFEKRNRTVD